MDTTRFPLVIPAIPGEFDEIEKTIASVIKKMDRLMADTDKLVKRLDAETIPEFNQTLVESRRALKSAENVMASDSPVLIDLRETLRLSLIHI